MRAILNKSWKQHPTKHQLYGHLPPITKTIQDSRTRYAGHCWRIKDKLISDVLLWTPSYGRTKAEQPARTYIQQLYEDRGCNPEDLPEAMNDREEWRQKVRDIRAGSTSWWWWWWWLLDSNIWKYFRIIWVVILETILELFGFLYLKPFNRKIMCSVSSKNNVTSKFFSYIYLLKEIIAL